MQRAWKTHLISRRSIHRLPLAQHQTRQSRQTSPGAIDTRDIRDRQSWRRGRQRVKICCDASQKRIRLWRVHPDFPKSTMIVPAMSYIPKVSEAKAKSGKFRNLSLWTFNHKEKSQKPLLYNCLRLDIHEKEPICPANSNLARGIWSRLLGPTH